MMSNTPQIITTLEITHVHRVLDGDTFEASFSARPTFLGEKRKFRLYGIDAPEARGRNRCAYERLLNVLATRFLSQCLLNGGHVTFDCYGTDSFGRFLGRVLVNDTDIAQVLLDNTLVTPYQANDISPLAWKALYMELIA